MSRSEFRWNKKRKHYAYLHKDIGSKRKNLLITSKPIMKKGNNDEIKTVSLYHHPNSNKDGTFYVVPRNYLDEEKSFDNKTYPWSWHKNDKRKIKRLKKGIYRFKK